MFGLDSVTRAVFTKSVVTPVLGVAGVGGAMAVYGAAGVVVSAKPSPIRYISIDKISCFFEVLS